MVKENIAFKVNNAVYYRSVIQGHPLFAYWPGDVLSQFTKLWDVVNFDAGQTIVSEGMVIDTVFFIVEGHAEIITHDKMDPTQTHTLAVLSAGESVGLSPTGLFSTTNERTATAVALTRILAITIKLKTLQTFLQHHADLNKDFEKSVARVYKMQLAKESNPFARLSVEKLSEIADKIDEIEAQAEEIIFKEGDPADNCYLIMEGKVEISKADAAQASRISAVLSKPAIFGEMALVLNAPRNATVKTLAPCKFFRLHRSELLKLYAQERAFAKNLSTIVIKRSCPEQIADIIDRHEMNADLTPKIVLKNIKNKQLYYLNERSYFAWVLMDGSNSIEDIILSLREQYKQDVTEDLIELVADLYHNGFVTMRGHRFPKRKKESIWTRLLRPFR